MTGIVTNPTTPIPKLFKATINSATLPTIATTSTVPSGKTWIAHGVCKVVEAATTSIGTSASSTAIGAVAAIVVGGDDDPGSGGVSGSGSGGTGCLTSSWGFINCFICGHGYGQYCARYCGLAGYGYGFGYGYGTARGYSDNCVAIGVNGSTSWTQVVPSGFTVTTWLYYEQQDC